MATAPERRRRAFSLNGLAIQVSAFALSFMLVALFVVGSSRAAFVEPNETVTERAPVGQEQPQAEAPVLVPPATPDRARPTPRPAEPPAPTPAPRPAPAPEVGLSDDSSGTAMFTDDLTLAPGVPDEQCIRVAFDGSVDPEPILLYAASVEGALAPFLDLTVELGSSDGGVFGDCSGFVPTTPLFSGSLADFEAAHADYDGGLPTWDPAGPGESRGFRFSVTVRDDPAAEGLSAGFGFVWEARG